VQLSPWEIRKQFAWAAILVLLLAGMSVVSSSIIHNREQQQRQLTLQFMPPPDAFRDYVGRLMQQNIPLQHRDSHATQLVSWLEENGARQYTPPTAFMGMSGVGCGMLDGPSGKISVICFDTENGKVHLFVTCAKSLNMQESSPPKRLKLHKREAMQWNDKENAYLFIAHDPEQPLPEIFL
jgi:hypothetical protein